MTSPAFQLAYLFWTSFVFGVTVLFTRARARRVLGAVCSIAVFTALSAPIDSIAFAHKWWSYPWCPDPPHPPLAIYLGQATMFVGTIALIGWRVQRGFGVRGVIRLVLVVCVLGFVRDYGVGAVLPEMIRFGPGLLPALADVVAWLVVVVVALGVSRIVAGSAMVDAPRGDAR